MISSRRFTVDIIGIIVTLIVLLFAAAFSLFLQIDPLTKAEGSTWNNGRSGTQQLYNWLGELGYRMRSESSGPLLPSSEDGILFILSPNKDFSRLERLQIDQWVLAGGTLILVQDSARPRSLMQQFDLRSRWRWPMIREAPLALPTLNWPLVGSVELRASRRIVLDCGQAAIHIGDCDNPVLVSFGRGQGQIYVMSTLYPFTNDGLGNGRNAQLVRNLVQLNAAPNTRILFDDVHHQAAPFWLVQTPGGWAIISLMILLLAYALQSNQRFGKARPSLMQEEPDRRDTAAFLNHLATAQKELDPERRIRRHYWQRLKRRLAQRYSSDPQLPDKMFLAEIRPYVDETTVGHLIYLMVQFDRQQINDLDFQQWTASVVSLRETLDVS